MSPEDAPVNSNINRDGTPRVVRGDFLMELRGLEPRCSQRCEPLSDVSSLAVFKGRGDAIGRGPEWGGLLTPR